MDHLSSTTTALNAMLLGVIGKLRLEVATLTERCNELEEKINKNSQNSSKPPSLDGYNKLEKNDDDQYENSPNPKSLRS